MMKRKFRPFWSYNIIETEEWLAELSAQGWEFVKFNRFTRVFYFRKSEPKTYTFRIGYDKVQNDQLPKALLSEGWVMQFQDHHWFVMINEKPNDDIKIKPARENIIGKNREYYNMHTLFLYYCLLMVFVNNHSSSFMLFLPKKVISLLVGSAHWIEYIGSAFTLIAITVSIYSIYIIRLNIKQIVKAHFKNLSYNEDESLSEYLPFEFEEEQKLKKAGLLLKRRKITWTNEPDKFEKWLEGMESKGFNLIHVNPNGTKFYFLKGDKRTISYCTEYQTPDESAFFLHKDNGWRHIFSTKSYWKKWTIWAKEYEEGEEKPQLYSGRDDYLKAARKITLSNLITNGSFIIIFVFLQINYIWSMNRTEPHEQYYVFPNLGIFIILLLSVYTFQSLSYFYRVKKKYEY